MTRAEAARLTWDELENLGLDDCGLPLSECPGLPPARPLVSWHATRQLPRLLIDGTRDPDDRWHHGPDGLTDRQRAVLTAVRSIADHREAALSIDMDRKAFSAMLTRLRRRGFGMADGR